MLHTIQAVFLQYFFAPKGFLDYRSQFYVLNILSGVIFGATGHVGVNTESKLPQATEVWTGFKALTNYSSSISVTSTSLPLLSSPWLLGTDLTQNLYKIIWPMGFRAPATTLPKAPLPDHCALPISRFLWSRLLDRDPLQWTWNHARALPCSFWTDRADSVPFHLGLGQYHFLPPLR